MTRLLRLAVVPLAAVVLAGCGETKHPVKGTVTLDDGTPVTQGVVVFERLEGGPAVTARGEIQSDGKYELSTDKPGDGVPTGKYRVLVNPRDLTDTPDEEKTLPYDTKYLKFQASGLSFEVKPGANEYAIKLSKPAPKPAAPAEAKPGDAKPEPKKPEAEPEPKKPDGGAPK
jgi:hypothetical protein